MSLFSILLVLIIAGVALGLVNKSIPMDGKVKRIINVVVVLLLLFWLFKMFGV
ncbi:MAG: Thivi_2564 family membrane protein [Spirosomataceae bacterium]